MPGHPVFVQGGRSAGRAHEAERDRRENERGTEQRQCRTPEVVLLSQALDALHRHADLVAPDGERLVILLEDGHPHALRGEAELLRRELPGPPGRRCGAVRVRAGDAAMNVSPTGNCNCKCALDCVLLEVVAEGEVPEHLEEGVVALRHADVLDVVRADALLGRGGAGNGAGHLWGWEAEGALCDHRAEQRDRRLRVLDARRSSWSGLEARELGLRGWQVRRRVLTCLAHEHRLELEHARNREQHGRVFRDQGRAGEDLVPALLEEVLREALYRVV